MTTADLLTEDVISLAAAGKLFPGSRGADRVNPSTVYRWTIKGVCSANGLIKLESFRAGSRVFTTKQAVERFVAALSAPVEPVAAPAVRTPSARQKAAEAAAEALKKLGA
jgi:hypothetical protein